MSLWINVPMPGTVVKSSHPITCLNPHETFEVVDVIFDGGAIYVRGDKTCWFHINMISPV